MVTFKINRDFVPHQDLMLDLPALAKENGIILQNNRNVISKVETQHGSYVVKDFAGMYFLNRLQYSLFRKSKAIRSYINSEKLNALGIATPAPVGWIDQYSWGLLSKSYFISLFYPCQTVDQYLKSGDTTGIIDKHKLFQDLAAFALRLHRAGILHDDFSVGNIFVIPKDGGFDFALIDLNRMRFGKVGFRQALRNLRKIQLSSNDQEILIQYYARLTGRSPASAITMYHRIRSRAAAVRAFRKKIRHHTVGYFERLIAH